MPGCSRGCFADEKCVVLPRGRDGRRWELHRKPGGGYLHVHLFLGTFNHPMYNSRSIDDAGYFLCSALKELVRT